MATNILNFLFFLSVAISEGKSKYYLVKTKDWETAKRGKDYSAGKGWA